MLILSGYFHQVGFSANTIDGQLDTMQIRKYEFIDPNMLSKFGSTSNGTFSKDEISYMKNYLQEYTNRCTDKTEINQSTSDYKPWFGTKKKTKVSIEPNSSLDQVIDTQFSLDIHHKTHILRMKQLVAPILESTSSSMDIQSLLSLKNSFPIPRERHCMCMLPSKSKPSRNILVIMGGIGNQKIRLNDIWFLDVDTMMWKEGELKGFSGNDKNSSHTSTWFSPFLDSNSYTIKDGYSMYLGIKIPSPRYYHSMVAINESTLIVFGGYDGNIQNDLWILSILDRRSFTFEWKRVEFNKDEVQWPLPRYNHWSGIIKDKMIIVGGTLDKNTQTNDMWVFDVDSYRWNCIIEENNQTDISVDHPEKRSDHKCAIIGKFLIMFGGVHAKQYIKDFYVLDMETLVWKRYPGVTSDDKQKSLPGRIGFCMTQLQQSNTIFIMGGIIDKDNFAARSNDMWIIETNQEAASVKFLSKVAFLNTKRIGSNYIIQKVLGQGGQGKVFLVKDEESIQDCKYYALKRMEINFDQNAGFNKSVASNEVFNEILIVQQLRNENILPITSFFLEKRTDDTETNNSFSINILMPYCESGDLTNLHSRRYSVWKKRGILFEELEIVSWLLQIATGLEYVHSKNIIHRDLKPSNIFVTVKKHNSDSSKVEYILKLGDFGVSKNVSNSLAKTTCGTMHYIAPEIYNQESYSQKADIWSFGCIMAYFIYGGQLRTDLKITTNQQKLLGLFGKTAPKGDTAIYEMIEKLPSKNEIYAFVRDCLQEDPSKRPSSSELVQRLSVLKEKLLRQEENRRQRIKDAALDCSGDSNTFNSTDSCVSSSDGAEQTVPGDTNQALNFSASSDRIDLEPLVHSTQIEMLDTIGFNNEADGDTHNEHSQTQDTQDFKTLDEATWINLQSSLMTLEEEGLISEDETDELSRLMIRNNVGLRRFFLAVLSQQQSNTTSTNQRLAKQFKRFLRISKEAETISSPMEK